MSLIIKILIVEDEDIAVKRLLKELEKLPIRFEVIGAVNSVQGFLDWMRTRQEADLIFMDIHLTDGLSFEIFKHVEVSIPVIFTTAYDEYMLSAFKVNSVDYLLKPIEENNLRRAIEKFKSIHYDASVKGQVIKQLLNELNKGYKNRFLIKVGEHYKSITDNEIACFYILERATFIRTSLDKDYTIDYSLDNLQKIIDSILWFYNNYKNGNGSYCPNKSLLERSDFRNLINEFTSIFIELKNRE